LTAGQPDDKVEVNGSATSRLSSSPRVGGRASVSVPNGTSGLSLFNFRINSTLAGRGTPSRRPSRGQEVCTQVNRRGTHRTATAREEREGRWLETPAGASPAPVRPRATRPRLDRRAGRRRVRL